MFQTKSKIFAASVLGVSILLVGSLVSFTIYIVANNNVAYDDISVGYIIGSSYDESYKVSQQLLKDKLVQHALVVPTLLQNQKEPVGKVELVSTPSYLLLVQTSAELIPGVKAVVKKAFKGSNTLQIIFSPVAKGSPYLFFVPPTAPRDQAATKDTLISARDTGTAAATDRLLTTNSVRLSPDKADRQNGNFLRKLAAITGRSPTLGKLDEWPRMDTLVCYIANPFTIPILTVSFGRPFLIKVVGIRKAGYTWMFGLKTSPALEFEYADKNDDGSELADALVYFKVTYTQFGFQHIELNYVDPAGLGPTMATMIKVFIETPQYLQL